MASIQSAGYPIVTWTVNEKQRMLELMRLGVNGIISDRSDLLLEAVQEFDADNDGKSGDFLTPEGSLTLKIRCAGSSRITQSASGKHPS